MSKAKKVKVKPGDVFAVPLETGGYAIGLVARKRASRLLGYFWKKKFPEVPEDLDLSTLKKEDAYWIVQFSILGLEKGKWKIIGNMPNFRPEEWEVPKFFLDSAGGGKFIVTYDDKLNEVNRERVPCDYEPEGPPYAEDGLAGYLFVEKRLTRILG